MDVLEPHSLYRTAGGQPLPEYRITAELVHHSRKPFRRFLLHQLPAVAQLEVRNAVLGQELRPDLRPHHGLLCPVVGKAQEHILQVSRFAFQAEIQFPS